MFEISKKEYVNKTIRIPDDLLKKAEQVANKKGISLNQLVIQCCEYAIKNLKNENSTEQNGK